MRKRNKKIMNILFILNLIMPATYAAEQQQHYTLPPMVVEDDKIKQQTEDEKNILTGGDVSVITRKEIEQKHYQTIAEAIMSVPGVAVSSSGYHAQAVAEATYGWGVDTVRINGDSRVTILIDGRRMGNATGGLGNSKNNGILAMLTNLNNVERIEVIKGQGSIAYGSDGAGGVINIITRKGAEDRTTVDTAFGSWGQQDYRLSSSGTAGGWRYFLAGSWLKGDDTKYRDSRLDQVISFRNTAYDDKSLSLRLDNDFDKDHALSIYYSHMSGHDQLPSAAPIPVGDPLTFPSIWNYTSWNYKTAQPGDVRQPQYTFDSYVSSVANDVDVTYTFSRKDNIPSFIRAYKNYSTYFENYTAVASGSTDAVHKISTSWRPHDVEATTGAEVQFGSKQRKNDIVLSGLEWQSSNYSDSNTTSYTTVERPYISGYVQDRLWLDTKWTLTPGLRFSHYGDVTISGVNKGQNENRLTSAVFSNYAADKTTDIYASYSQLFNAPYSKDYISNINVQPETGDLYTIGINKKFDAKTTLNLGMSYSDISNAIIRYTLYSNDTGTKKTYVNNVDQTKKAYNLSIGHKFSDKWQVTAAYSYDRTNQLDPRDGSSYGGEQYDDVLYRKIYPANLYRLDTVYTQGNWNVNLSGRFYSGCDTQYFSSSHFYIWDLSTNYTVNKDRRYYIKVENLTDKAYESKASGLWSVGSFPMPSRSIVIGIEQSF